jgi:hypothetical protein
MLEKGKLYRVNDYALSDEVMWYQHNRELVAHHGYLWLWEGERNKHDEPQLRAVSTGYVELWFPDELEGADA